MLKPIAVNTPLSIFELADAASSDLPLSELASILADEPCHNLLNFF
ncbi:hypothetical protein [Vibrio mediterranei]|nr:hypothetical protein [Vibrio mediterranei]MCG9660415.1 hypothetical protein [Vibrio mediterranei]